jgi:hypothetical protein
MPTFEVGQEIVCVDESPASIPICVQKGHIYRVAEIFVVPALGGSQREVLRLAGIARPNTRHRVNPPLRTSRFRALPTIDSVEVGLDRYQQGIKDHLTRWDSNQSTTCIGNGAERLKRAHLVCEILRVSYDVPFDWERYRMWDSLGGNERTHLDRSHTAWKIELLHHPHLVACRHALNVTADDLVLPGQHASSALFLGIDTYFRRDPGSCFAERKTFELPSYSAGWLE